MRFCCGLPRGPGSPLHLCAFTFARVGKTGFEHATARPQPDACLSSNPGRRLPSLVRANFAAAAPKTRMASRRTYGTGRIFIKHRSYYGRWRTAGGGYTNRKLGPVRKPGTSEGLTKRQAERRLRELMGTIYDTSQASHTIAIVGALFIEHLQAKGRSRSHLETVESHLRVHLVPFFGDRPVDRIAEPRVTAMVAHLRRSGKAPKTIRNVLSTLHSVLDHAVRLRWITLNPCRLVDGPDLPSTVEVRYLDPGELERCYARGSPPTTGASSSARST